VSHLPLLYPRALAAIALMAALTAVGAWIRIPLPYVPVTLQMSFVYLSGVWLGARRGAIAQTIYIGVGLIGFPLFAKGGGPQYIFEPSFGYLCGFVPAAFAAGFLAQRHTSYFPYLGAAAAATFLVYLPGIFWLYLILNYVLGQETSPTAALALGLTALPKDLALIPINAYFGLQIRRRLPPLSNQDMLGTEIRTGSSE
jgi:biotin transport system substrate-specific component